MSKIENTILYKELKKEGMQKEDIDITCRYLDGVYSVLFIMKKLKDNDKLKGLYNELKSLLKQDKSTQ